MTTHSTLSPSFDWRAGDLTWPVTTDVGRGLAGVVATGTRVMWLDPASGSLAYRGHPVEQLALQHSFEEVAYLLISGDAPDDEPAAFGRFRSNLRASRRLPTDVVRLIRELGQMAALVAEIATHRAGRQTEPSDDRSSLADELLRAVTGSAADPDDVRLLDLLWVLYAAHGLDAPTFTSMVVASCLADPYANVTAGLSALRGRRQGGATEAVMHQLETVAEPSEAAGRVRDFIAGGGKIAGFGHRSYRMPDPRVVVLRRELAALARRRGLPDVFERSRAIEEAATAELAPRGVHININFYAAPIFSLLGADGPLGPCLYAVGRTAGMVALVREAIDSIRLVRPLSRYVGPVGPRRIR